MSREKLDAALDYTRRGWPVLPVHTIERGCCSCQRADCGSPGKHPLSKGWRAKATTDLEQVRKWWPEGGFFQPNVAVATGTVIDVLDVDGVEGLDELSRIVGGDEVAIPCGPAVLTPGGGAHLYFAATGAGSRVRFAPGLDWRGAGAFVVAPPSLGLNGISYSWHIESAWRFGPATPFVPPPGWLAELLTRRAVPEAPARLPVARGRGTAYGSAALDDEVRTVATGAVGCRNDTLVRAAYKIGGLVAGGVLEAEVAARELLAAALRAGLPEAEARRTVGSGLKAGADHAREVPA